MYTFNFKAIVISNNILLSWIGSIFGKRSNKEIVRDMHLEK